MMGENYFGIVDYIVLILSLVICLVIGVVYAYLSKNTNEDLLVGGRTQSIFPVAASIMVSFFSAITVLGYPAEIYSFGMEIFLQTIFQAFAIAASAYLLLPFFYPMKLTSIYEYVEARYDSKAVRQIGTTIFILEELCLASMVLYAPSIALETFIGLPMWISVFGIGICGTIYTSIGGLKAVLATDTFQFFLIIIGLGGIVIKAFMEAGGVAETFSLAYQNGRLKFIDFTVNPFMRHNFVNFLLGTFVVTTIRNGIHQLQVQRYSSLPSLEKAKQAMLFSVPLKVFTMCLCLLSGIAIYGAMGACDPVLSKRIAKIDQIVPLFVVENLIHIPGSMGLFTACIFSAVLSSMSSILNSLAAVTWEDFLSRLHYFQLMGPKAQTNVSRLLSLLYGIVSIMLAFTSQYLGTIYAASFAVTGVSAGSLVGLFTMAIFMPCINKIGAATGMLGGYVIMAYVGVLGFVHKPANKIVLPSRLDNCPLNTTLDVVTSGQATMLSVNGTELEAGFAGNIYSLSYIMYPFVGAVISIIIGFIVSAATGGLTQKQLKRVNPKYIHPLIARFMRRTTANQSNLGKEMHVMPRSDYK